MITGPVSAVSCAAAGKPAGLGRAGLEHMPALTPPHEGARCSRGHAHTRTCSALPRPGSRGPQPGCIHAVCAHTDSHGRDFKQHTCTHTTSLTVDDKHGSQDRKTAIEKVLGQGLSPTVLFQNLPSLPSLGWPREEQQEKRYPIFSTLRTPKDSVHVCVYK